MSMKIDFKNIALCRWRYWKQPQRFEICVGHRNKGLFV